MAEDTSYSRQHSTNPLAVAQHVPENTAVNGTCPSDFVAMDITPNLCIPPHSLPVANGGFCLLYRGQLQHGSTQPSSEVVVKILIPKNSNTKLAHMRLAREAAILQDAQYFLVVEFYGTAIIQGHPALVLKWYEKGDAVQALKGKPTAQKLKVIKDIATAMAYLQSKNIVHGDLKGNNVLISDDGRGILTDFGLSHFTDKHTGYTTSSPSCTIPWLSPELAKQFLDTEMSDPTIRTRTFASDIWAFGSTAFELLSGRTPYEHLHSATMWPVLLAISRGISPLMSCPSIALEPLAITRVLNQCWQVDPSHRPSMAEVVGMLSLL